MYKKNTISLLNHAYEESKSETYIQFDTFFNKEEIDKELVLRRCWSLYIYSIFQIYGQNSKTCYLLPSYSIENDSFIEHDFLLYLPEINSDTP